MGFLVIIPFAALAAWVVVRIFLWLAARRLRRPEWWKAFGLLALAGVALGVWLRFTFFTHYSVSKRHMSGFPFPLEITSQEKPDSPWIKSDLPPSIRAKRHCDGPAGRHGAWPGTHWSCPVSHRKTKANFQAVIPLNHPGNNV